jgi:hypothetical protein
VADAAAVAGDVPGADAAAEAEEQEEAGGDRAARLGELERLFTELVFGPERAVFKEEDIGPMLAGRLQGASPTILSLQSHTRVASEYVRVMDVADFADDPERIEPFLGPIILCPSPELDELLTISREQLLKRLKQYGVPLESVALTGAHQVLVLRTKAHRPGGGGTESAPAGASVEKGGPVLIVREGEFFRIEEWGTALDGGQLGDPVAIEDRKGRTFKARVTGAGTVVPVEERE